MVMREISLEQVMFVAASVGAVVSFVLNFVAGFIKEWRSRVHEKAIQERDHQQKRIELHISFLRDRLEKIERDLDSGINSNLGVLGYGEGLLANNEASNINVANDSNMVVSKTDKFVRFQMGGELEYLKLLVEHFNLDSQFLVEIESCQQLIKSRDPDESQVVEEARESILAFQETIAAMIKLKVLFKKAIHLLIDQLLVNE